LLLLLCAAGAIEATAATTEAWFEEVTAEAGIVFEHTRGNPPRYWFPEIMSGGAAWCDVDGDDWLDLYLVQGGDLEPSSEASIGNRLFRNLGNGSFVDVTMSAGVGDTGYGMGVACADFDGDGHSDLYVTNFGPNVLYRNRGDGTFIDVTEQAGVGHASWGASAAFLDYDRDSDLDLFVTNYVSWSSDRELTCTNGARERDYCQPENYNASARDVLYRNEGNGRFVDVSREAGMWAAFGNGLGVAVDDFNGDGWRDLYVTNDGTPNQLWINQHDGTFVDEALLAGCAVNMMGTAEAGMGAAAADFDADGDPDLFMTHLRGETHTLYLNQGGVFSDRTASAGLAGPVVPFTGFGTGFGDFDHDGHLDIFVANGRVVQTLAPIVEGKPFAEPNQLFRGQGNGRFEEVSPRGGTSLELVENGRAAAFADYDNDGDIDIAVVNNGGPAQLLRNSSGSRGQWVMFRLKDGGNRSPLGARLRVASGDRVQWRTAETAYSYCASNDPRVHVGLGTSETVDEVLVVWPDGTEETFGPFLANRLHELLRGTGREQLAEYDREPRR
ncbi:MAG: CRTAC1 family protein, partial [Thermoanaerobaculia bacterium]